MEFVKKMMSSVKGCGGLAPDFPYELEELLATPSQTGGLWSIHTGHAIGSQRDESKVSVTIFMADIGRRPNVLAALKNAVRRLKTMRHPHILKFIASAESDSEIMVATERVFPLAGKLEQLRQKPEALLWTTNLLLKAVQFLNSEAAIIHGNLRISSLFLTAAGELKLGGFELATGLKDEESLLCDFGRIVKDCKVRDWPPELSSPDASPTWHQIKRLPPSAVDSYMLGKVFCEIFTRVPAEINSFVQNATSTDPRKRPAPGDLLNQGASIFRGIKVLDIAEKLDTLVAMNGEQRESFLKVVHQSMPTLSEDFLCYKIVPCLISMFQIPATQNTTIGIRLLISCAGHLKSQELCSTITPVLTTLFAKPDRAIRIALLESLPSVIEGLDGRIVQETIYPPLISGFTDALPALREQTLKTSLLIAPKLTFRQLNGELLRFYARLQGDEQPGIRVNTTVCLSRVASLLDGATRQKVLGVAFVRALGDPFIPARTAGLAAISATLELLLPEEIARGILPAVVPLLVDPDVTVRQAASKATNLLLGKVQSYMATIPIRPLVDEPSVSEGKPANPPTLSNSQTATTSAHSWGLSSITERLMGSAIEKDPSSPPLPVKKASQPHMPGSKQPSTTTSRISAPVRTIQRKAIIAESQTSIIDGWDTEDHVDLNIEIPPTNIQETLETNDSSPSTTAAWQDDDNPWARINQTSPSHLVDDPWVQAGYAPSTLPVKTSISGPMVLGKNKPKLIDHF